MLLSQFPLTFRQNQNRAPRFIVQLLTILVLIGTVFVIFEMFSGKISLSSVLLLLLVNFVSGFRLELMSLIVSIRSSLIEITFFDCTNKINLLNLKESSDRLVIVAKRFLKLPNLYMLIKQNSLSLPRNLALETFGELLIVFSTQVNLLYHLYSTARKCCLLYLIKQKSFVNRFSKNSNLDD